MRAGSAIVTGANRGIGLELVRALADAGCEQVIGTTRSLDRAGELEAVQRERSCIRVLELDLTSEPSIERFAGEVHALTSSVGILVNNAGIPPGDETILTLPLADFRRQIDTHALGPLVVVRELLDLLHAGSVIANISSVLGGLHRISTNYAGYAQAKALQNAVTRSLAGALADRGVSVLALDPGWVSTAMGGPQAPVRPDEAAAGLLRLILEATPECSSTFRNFRGETLNW